jgi:hypothetical protein
MVYENRQELAECVEEMLTYGKYDSVLWMKYHAYYTVFLVSWSMGENQSEERYATGWGVWGGLTIFLCFSADFGRVTRERAEITSVAKYYLTAEWGGSRQTRNG